MTAAVELPQCGAIPAGIPVEGHSCICFQFEHPGEREHWCGCGRVWTDPQPRGES